MATTAQNNLVYARVTPVTYPVKTDGTADINQGDQVYLDTSAHVAKALGASDDANAANFLGVALESSYVNPYGTKQYGTGQIPVGTGDIYYFKTTSGDTYNHGDKVYVGADAQTVTNTIGGLTKVLGTVQFTPGQAAFAGGAGITVNVLVVPQYPSSGVA